MITLDKGLEPIKDEFGDKTIAYEMKLKELETKKENFCEDQMFAKKLRAEYGRCGSILIEKQYVISAGHCIDDKKQASTRSFVFGFNSETATVKKDQVYKGKIVERIYDGELDLVILKLDRPVVGFKPANWQDSKDLMENQNVTIVGNPLGLPKVYSSGRVRAIDSNYGTSTDVNCASGMSGAGYFNDNGKLMGVHIGGDPPSTFFSEEEKGKEKCLNWTNVHPGKYNFTKLTDTPRGTNTLIGGCAYIPISKIKPFLEKHLNNVTGAVNVNSEKEVN